MKTILIVNDVDYHYEILESVIVNVKKIFSLKGNSFKIFLWCHNNIPFKNYIKTKYPSIKLKFTSNYHYIINCTIYDKDRKWLDNKLGNKKYIAHEFTEKLKLNPNVWFLTPFGGDKKYLECSNLPFKNIKKNTNFPIYIIQGNLNDCRRNYKWLVEILESNLEKKFLLRIIGKGTLPECLEKFKDKIDFKKNLDFINFHKQFQDCYCILSLTSKQDQPYYYSKKLSSTINYSLGYRLKCIIDKELQNIYNLPNVETYNDGNDFIKIFSKTLDNFYKK